MREIKFRGRGAYQRSVWYVGDLVRCDDGRITIRENEAHEFYVDPATVGQYTGLKDKDGKEIYEGDILRDPDGKILKVVWNNGASSWECVGQLHHFLFIMRYMDLMQVIGNVHDNPELLERNHGNE